MELMPTTEEPTPRERLAYLANRWRFILIAAAAAGVLAFGVSELLPRRYTAVATVIIDPPGTNDPRASMVVNPTYLDSLRTFERFFTSDTLFEQAARRFHLEPGGRGLVALRQRVLNVAVERETRIIEVRATLPNPKDAIGLAQYITERSINANREEAEAADRDTLRNVTEEFDRAQDRLEKAQAQWKQVAQEGAPEALQSELSAAIGVLSEVERLEAQANAEAAEFQTRAHEADERDKEADAVIANSVAARAREYAKRAAELTGDINVKRRQFAEATQRHAVASGELDAARRAYEAALSRKRDFSALNGLRSEHMRVIDPGVEPQRPSSPDILLNTVGAFVLAACMAAAWLNLTARRPEPRTAFVRAHTAIYEEPYRSSR
jgi:uncharacterized protein involved in exopolysaccharide biosynthesis